MYTLGDYQRALCRLVSESGKVERTVELQRSNGMLYVRAGRDADSILGVKLLEDGTLQALTWNLAGELAGELRVVEPAGGRRGYGEGSER